MDAKDLVRSMIAELAYWGSVPIKGEKDAAMRTGMFDMVVHAAQVAHGTSPTAAREFVAEEVQERIVAMAG